MSLKDKFIEVEACQLQVGEVVPLDIYSKSGNLLFAKGQVIVLDSQLQHILQDGLFCISVSNAHCSIVDVVFSLKSDLAKAYEQIEAGKHEAFVLTITQLATKIQMYCLERENAILGAVNADHSGTYSLIHPIHCAVLCEIAAQHIYMPQLDRLSLICAALTQNISFHQTQELLLQKDTELSEEEVEIIRTHPLRSYQMLVEAGVTDNFWLEAVRNHHERIDGSGYPFRLKEYRVSTSSKIIAIADIYAAATRSRAYRDEILSKCVMQEIFNERGKKVSEHLTRVFVSFIGIYPPGTYVRLRNREIGIVHSMGEKLDDLSVGVVTDKFGNFREKILTRKTLDPQYSITKVLPFGEYKQLEVYVRLLWDQIKLDSINTAGENSHVEQSPKNSLE